MRYFPCPPTRELLAVPAPAHGSSQKPRFAARAISRMLSTPSETLLRLSGEIGRVTVASRRLDGRVPCEVRFQGAAPRTRVDEEVVELIYPLRVRAPDVRSEHALLLLDSSRVWRIEIGGGLCRLEADLADVRLAGLTAEGRGHRIDATFGPPIGDVPITLSGAVNELVARLPSTVPTGVTVDGRSVLIVEGQRQWPRGTQTLWRTSDYEQTTDRYTMRLRGDDSRVSLRHTSAAGPTD